ncbi:hypothetical protein NL676_014490 [Syzygium grande]|nr:hypothetical protein NL676_014490 [Syzygium grande]
MAELRMEKLCVIVKQLEHEQRYLLVVASIWQLPRPTSALGSVDERHDCFLTSRCSIGSRLVAQGASKPVWSIDREERYVLQSLGACDKEGIRAQVQAIETVKLGYGLTLSQAFCRTCGQHHYKTTTQFWCDEVSTMLHKPNVSAVEISFDFIDFMETLLLS